MDKSVNQSRLSRSQLPPTEAGNAALSLDQLTDLDQAISLSRGGRAETSSRPAAIIPRSVPKSAPKPTPKPTPKSAQPPVSSQEPTSTSSRPAPIIIPATPASSTDFAPAANVAPATDAAVSPVEASMNSTKTPSASSAEPSKPPVVPVRSAKEVINAMYAAENPARLSDYLGTSAKEIINNSRPAASDRDAKSASSLHHASSQRKMEATRPSASAIFRAAKSETTVVRTSLELDPKSPKSVKVAKSATKSPAKPSPIVINSRSRAENSRFEGSRASRAQNDDFNTNTSRFASRPTASVRPKKGQIKITTPSPTSIAVSAIEHAAGTVTGAAAAKTAAKSSSSIKATKPASKSTKPRPRGLVQDIARPAHGARAFSDFSTPDSPVRNARPLANFSDADDDDVIPISRTPRITKSTRPKAGNDAVQNRQNLPADSVKRRFRLAPKGFAAKKPEQARPARRKFMSFSNPDYTVPVPKSTPAIEIYGMTEPTPKEVSEKDGLGVVEDYRPANPDNPAMGTSASNHASSRPLPDEPVAKSTPDNNRYALGGQSPFFLKSVSVEKRPLSDAPTRRADTISPIYTDLGDEVPRKNVYDGKSASKSAKSQKSAKKTNPRDLPQRPTVIIPSNRRSHTPLFLLLILTVILGAAVGAAVYFFFFQ